MSVATSQAALATGRRRLQDLCSHRGTSTALRVWLQDDVSVWIAKRQLTTIAVAKVVAAWEAAQLE